MKSISSLAPAAFICVLFVASMQQPVAAKDSTNVAATSTADSFNAALRPFLTTHCVRCHNADESKGDRQFDALTGRIANENALIDYQDILDQLNLGEMPPADEPQPNDATKRKVIAWLTKRIKQYHQTTAAPLNKTVLRRLNAREYRNSVRDLLKLNMEMFNPTASFPKDDTVEHLDNIGEALETSGFLLARYLTSADQLIQRAMGPMQKPEVQTWTFRDGFRQQSEIDQAHRKTNQFDHMTLYDVIGADKHEGAYAPIDQFRAGVPLDGIYEIKIKAEAVNRIHPYDDEFLGTDRREPLRLGIRPGNRDAGKLHLPQPIEPLLAEIVLADQPEWYTTRIWLDRGFTPRFTFRNGLMDARNLWSKLIREYPDLFPDKIAKGIVSARFNAIKHGKLPQIHIHEVEIRGPISEKWPTASQRALLGDDFQKVADGKEIDRESLRKHLKRFAANAFRRPVQDDELEPAMRLMDDRQSSGRTQIQAYGDALKSVLCSPSFLYLDEGNAGTLTDHALASRLSYFLWSSCPDERLRRLADDGTLSDTTVLAGEVNRMLQDPKSTSLVDGFLESWLTLRDLGSAPPDRRDFRDYYHYDLGTAMRTETKLFTRHLIDEDQSLLNFIDSDFTFVNKPLARLYGLPTPQSDGFERIALDHAHRGGLLGQASVLTVSANGIDTSPVVRGVWVLENFLGTPPSPPPPDVEPLDPDTRGAKTIRQQLQKHRENASCNDCHRKIDPLGFALENFDPIGRWRTSYGRNNPIDASGQMPGGREFQDIAGLKKILLDQKRVFARSLTQKLMAYAIGRPMTVSDRPSVDHILDQAKAADWGLRSLIQAVVQSEPFLRK